MTANLFIETQFSAFEISSFVEVWDNVHFLCNFFLLVRGNGIYYTNSTRAIQTHMFTHKYDSDDGKVLIECLHLPFVLFVVCNTYSDLP